MEDTLPLSVIDMIMMRRVCKAFTTMFTGPKIFARFAECFRKILSKYSWDIQLNGQAIRDIVYYATSNTMSCESANVYHDIARRITENTKISTLDFKDLMFTYAKNMEALFAGSLVLAAITWDTKIQFDGVQLFIGEHTFNSLGCATRFGQYWNQTILSSDECVCGIMTLSRCSARPEFNTVLPNIDILRFATMTGHDHNNDGIRKRLRPRIDAIKFRKIRSSFSGAERKVAVADANTTESKRSNPVRQRKSIEHMINDTFEFDFYKVIYDIAQESLTIENVDSVLYRESKINFKPCHGSNIRMENERMDVQLKHIISAESMGFKIHGKRTFTQLIF